MSVLQLSRSIMHGHVTYALISEAQSAALLAALLSDDVAMVMHLKCFMGAGSQCCPNTSCRQAPHATQPDQCSPDFANPHDVQQTVSCPSQGAKRQAQAPQHSQEPSASFWLRVSALELVSARLSLHTRPEFLHHNCWRLACP